MKIKEKLNERDRQTVSLLNEFRIKNPFFKKFMLLDFCIKNNIKSKVLLISILKEKNIISKAYDDQYIFTLDKPIHISMISNIYKEITLKCSKKKEVLENKEELSEEKAIKFLKEKGFIIYKQL